MRFVCLISAIKKDQVFASCITLLLITMSAMSHITGKLIIHVISQKHLFLGKYESSFQLNKSQPNPDKGSLLLAYVRLFDTGETNGSLL